MPFFNRIETFLDDAEGVTAMRLEGAVSDLVQAIHAHPTLSEGVHEALENVFGAAIHM